jgi:glutamate 5-kinase
VKFRAKINSTQRWVVKIGSALLTEDGQGLKSSTLAKWVEQMAGFAQESRELVIVSSGAVAEGMSRMGWKTRPDSLHELQAAAAIGQMGLIHAYEACFQHYNRHTAQILVTRDDLTNRIRYLNARSTLRTLLDLQVIPIVNENDTVATDELRFGDNDTLAALIANLIEADLLILLTDQLGLFDCDPRKNSNAHLITEMTVDDFRLDTFASGSVSGLGRGGMITKIRAARLAARSGAATIITSGRGDNVLTRIYAGEVVGTLLTPTQTPQTAKKRWLAGHLQPAGSIVIDAGAVCSLRDAGRSLLAVGVKSVHGDFNRGDVVICVDEQNREIARGLINYSSKDTNRIKGQASYNIKTILGYVDQEELIHRDNLVII